MGLEEEVREAELIVYGRACPNCGGFISDRRLRLGAPCTSCLKVLPRRLSFNAIYRSLKAGRRLGRYRELYEFNKLFNDLLKFFVRCVGNEPWSIQKLWLKRVAKGASFAMIAPTGIGKTTFGLVVALYLAIRGWKSYIVVPTTTLAIQLERKLEEMMSRADIIARHLVIHSRLKRREKEAREELLSSKDGFDILVTTSNYLMRNADKIVNNHDFKFIFIDDVDAVLKGSKAINYILRMAGFNDDDIEAALRAIKLKRELAFRGGDAELVKELGRIEERLERKRSRVKKLVIIASATGNPRGVRVKLFKELMGFEIGARPEFIRNVVDTYEVLEGDVAGRVAELVNMLGRGGLVFVPIDMGIEYAEKLAEELLSRGVNARAIHSRNIKAIESFIAGEVSVLVGVATYYGVLVRGIDLPEIIRYAIFIDVPRHKVSLRLRGASAQDVIRLLPIVRDAVTDEEVRRRIERYMVRIRRLVRRTGGFLLKTLSDVISGAREAKTPVEKEMVEAYNLLKDLLSDSEVVKAIKRNPEVVIIEDGGELYVLIPDAPTYIQASGRTSRLFLGGISKGLSVVLASDMRLLKGLEKRLRWLIEDFKFVPLSDIDVESVSKEINRDREAIRKLREGLVPKDLVELKGRGVELKTALLIVESPNKARTIARFFGRPSTREYGKLRVYEVNLGNYTLLITASGGHIYDLITDHFDVDNIYGIAYYNVNGRTRFIPIYTTLKRCLDKGHQFTVEPAPGEKLRCPACGSENIVDAVATVEAIRDVALEVDEVLVGTDPDTEGEKIAFDIVNLALLSNRNVKRVEFHEVTRRAIIEAIRRPRDIDINLVKAQLIRRIEDRWIGFSLSKQLQTEFWQQFCARLDMLKELGKLSELYYGKYRELCSEYRDAYRNLSAGRVQTPVLGWVIKAYEEHARSKRHYITVVMDGLRLSIPIPEELRRRKRLDKRSIEKVIVELKDLGTSEETISSLPPYTTDSALSDINSRLKLPAPRAMQVLQDLFELGFITYHRTDSTRISEAGIAVAREYLKDALGSEFSSYYSPKSWGVGGAHEGIRPTRPIDSQTLRKLIAEGVVEPVRRLTKEHFAVYDLVFRRFIASQTKPARVRKQRVKVVFEVLTHDGERIRIGEQEVSLYVDVIFDGFNRFYRLITPKKLPEIRKHEFERGKYDIVVKFEKPLHSEASLVKAMRDREIGRPSTYAKIIDTLFKRGYVTYDRAGRGIIPRPIGVEVYSYLIKNYSNLVSEERTRSLERRMKEVEEGKVNYEDVINELNEELQREVGIAVQEGVKLGE